MRKRNVSKLRLRRIENGWRQDEVARAAEIDTSYLSLIESGHRKPSSAVLAKLAEVFEVKPSTVRGWLR